MTYITCEDLALGYDGRIVTEHIDFQVEQGNYLYIVGENGAGKSTLMKTLLHLIEPVGGRLQYAEGIQPYEIGYLPQQTVVQKDFPASVWEIVLSGSLAKCGHKPFYGKQEKKAAEENLKKMGIWDLRRKCYRNLSGGQQQRVLLARALSAAAKLLLLDEPVNGLDPKAAAEFYRLIQELNESGVTVIMVSHDIQAAVAYATHILHVGKNGNFFGETGDYLASDMGKLFSRDGGEKNE